MVRSVAFASPAANVAKRYFDSSLPAERVYDPLCDLGMAGRLTNITLAAVQTADRDAFFVQHRSPSNPLPYSRQAHIRRKHWGELTPIIPACHGAVQQAPGPGCRYRVPERKCSLISSRVARSPRSATRLRPAAIVYGPSPTVRGTLWCPAGAVSPGGLRSLSASACYPYGQ